MEIAKDTSGNEIPVWFNNVHRPEFPPLDKNIKTEVCIIGAGITGLTTAYRLVSEGKKVVVIDDGRIASGESGRTSAHLTNVLDDRYIDIERVHGIEGAKLAAASHNAAIDFIEDTVKKENIECDFLRVNGYLFPDEKDSFEILEKEAVAAKRAGITNVQLSKTPPDNTFAMKGCLIFPEQAQFHPLRYLAHLAKSIVKKGGDIFEFTHAMQIEKHKTAVNIKTAQGFTIHANQVVVATNVPINDRYIIHTKQEPNRTYIIGALVPQNTLKTGLYWDTGHPYHYIRVVKGDYSHANQPCDLLIIGGEDHRVGRPPYSYETCFKHLESWAKKYFPQILAVDFRWSGQIIEPVDYLAYIGNNPLDKENIFIATGDSGNGLTHGTLAGILLGDLILKKPNPWIKLYKPSRKSLKTLNRYIKNNLVTGITYLNYLTPGEGTVIRRGLKKIAVYRDENGVVHECSAICPHLKSIVQWNSAEKTWDCPAHGSRFTAKGEVINGPANSGLTFCVKP